MSTHTSNKSQSGDWTPFRAGIVGCGRIGCGFDDDSTGQPPRTHAGAYRNAVGVELVALSDCEQSKLDRYARKFEVAGRYTDYRDMLEQQRLDVLSICTCSDTHLRITQDAACAGVKVIFCEKPIADSLEAADEMIVFCERHGVALVVDHQRRFDRFHQEIATYLRRGELGRVRQVSCFYTAGLANTATHLFDLLRFFFGEVTSVRAWTSGSPSPNRQDENLDGFLQFEKGPSVSLQACDVRDYVIFEINVLGAKGRLRIIDSGFGVGFEQVVTSPRFAGYGELSVAPAPLQPPEMPDFLPQAIIHIVDILRTGCDPVSTGRDGRQALEIICAMRESARCNGEQVALPLAISDMVVASK